MVLWNRVHCAGAFHWQNIFMQIICWENSFVLLSELKVHNIRDESHLRTLLITSPGYNFNLCFNQKWWRNEKYLRIVRDGFVDNLNMCLYQRYKSSLGHFGYKSSVDKTQKCEDKQEGGACPTWSNIFWPINPTFIIKLNLWHLLLSHLVRICSGKYTEIIKRIRVNPNYPRLTCLSECGQLVPTHWELGLFYSYFNWKIFKCEIVHIHSNLFMWEEVSIAIKI